MLHEHNTCGLYKVLCRTPTSHCWAFIPHCCSPAKVKCMLLKSIFTNRYQSRVSNTVLPCKAMLPTGNKRHLASLRLPRATATCPVSRTRKPSSYPRSFQRWMLSLSGKFSKPTGNPTADTESSEPELAPDALENKWISFCYRSRRRPKCFICQDRNSHSSENTNVLLKLLQNEALPQKSCAKRQLRVPSMPVCNKKCIFYSW